MLICLDCEHSPSFFVSERPQNVILTQLDEFLGVKISHMSPKVTCRGSKRKRRKRKNYFLLKYNYEKMPILQNYLLSFFEYTLSPSLSRSPILAPLYRSNCVKITPWGLWSEKIKKVVALSVRTYLFFSYNKSIFFLRKNIVFMQKV